MYFTRGSFLNPHINDQKFDLNLRPGVLNQWTDYILVGVGDEIDITVEATLGTVLVYFFTDVRGIDRILDNHPVAAGTRFDQTFIAQTERYRFGIVCDFPTAPCTATATIEVRSRDQDMDIEPTQYMLTRNFGCNCRQL